MIVPVVIPKNSENIENEIVEKPFSAHRIFCIDCSGSMYGSLSDIATQLKNKIPTLIGPNDFMTLIWFSGRGQFGTIFEHISVNDLKDIQKVNSAIDRYLHCVGSTGFVEPIRLAKEMAQKYQEIPQIFFLSDGGENSWDRKDCEKAFEEIQQEKISLVIVEYQYYCDRMFLSRLAELANATSIFNEDFNDYDNSFELYMKNRIENNSQVISSTNDVFFMENEQLIIRRPSSTGNIILPLSVEEAYAIDSSLEIIDISNPKSVYMGMLYALKDKKPVVMQRLVKELGDVYITRLYSSCFSKQDYSRLTEHIRQCIIQPDGNAFRDGQNKEYVVKEDAFTVIDLLGLLESDKSARFYPYHPSFVYTRISKEVKDEKVRFVATPSLGSEFTLVFNQSRANISLGCQVYGYNITEREEDGEEEITSTKAYRNYSVLKDGIKNIKILPVSMSESVFTKLMNEGCISAELDNSYKKNKVYMVDITNLPVVNRAFVNQPFLSSEFCQHHLHINELKTEMKFLKKMYELVNKEDDDDKDKEEDDKEKYKREKRDATVVRDFYVAPELQVKIAKCSTIPTVNDKLLSKLANATGLTVSEALFENIYGEYTEYSNSNKNTKEELKEWLKVEMKNRKDELRVENNYVEKAKMALLIGCVWFSDVNTDTKTFSVPYHGVTYSVTIEINDINVYMD
jgi:hypothetical protein